MSFKTARILFIVVFLTVGCTMWLSEGVAFILLSILITYSAFWVKRKFKYFRISGIRVKGKVIEYKSDGEGGSIDIVEFTTKSGDTIKGSTFDIESRFGGEKNSEVDLLYDPKHPSEFITDNTHPLILTKVTVVTVVLLCFIFGCLSLGGYLPGSR